MELHTKEDFRNLMHTLLDPLKPLYSPGGARLRIGGAGVTYSIDAIEMEAFSRPLWALVPFWMGGGHDAEFEEIYRRGLANGTDPEHPEYWGGFADYDQRFVEMAAIACGLLLTHEVLDNCVVSVWSPFPGIRVRTTVTPTETGHCRRHEIESEYACTAYDCGFSIQKFTPDFEQKTGENTASVQGAGCRCTVRGSGEGCVVGADPNTNVLYRNTEIPAIRYHVAKGKTVLETEIVTEYH